MIDQIKQLIIELGKELKRLEWKCVTAESCTGGGLCYWITAVPGSSAWFDRGFVTYSNLAKEELLGVSSDTIAQYGAVSAETARNMVEGALERSQAQISVAITGIAGPDGGTLDKPIGTIWIAWAGIHMETQATQYFFSGDRQQIRLQSIAAGLQGLLQCINK